MSSTLRRLPPLALLLALTAAPAVARTYTLSTFADDTLTNGNCTLREALRAARDDVPVDACLAGEAADTILLSAGTYPFSGQETFIGSTDLEIRGNVADPGSVIVDLQGVGRFLYMDSAFAGGTLALRGFTVTGGDIPGVGGALVAIDYAVTLDRMHLSGNHSGDRGGAVYFANLNGGALVVNQTAFLGNSVVGRGGGLWVYSANRIDLRDVAFSFNSAVSGGAYGDAWGGGLYLEAATGSVATLHRCDFDQNFATATGTSSANSALGGGARLSAGGGVIEVTDSTFVRSSASVTTTATGQTQIAALSADAYLGGTIRMDRILVDLSAAAFPNGARDVDLHAAQAASVTLSNAQVTSGSGSGVKARTVTDGSVSIVQVTAADYDDGAGVILDTAAGGQVTLRGALLALNDHDIESYGGGVFMFTNCIGLFPGFVDAPGGNFRLLPGSAAVDATVPDPSQGLLDRDHAPRFIGIDPDCGAYELDGLFGDGFEGGDVWMWSDALNG